MYKASDSTPTTPVPTPPSMHKYYPDLEKKTCIADGKHGAYQPNLYDTLEECCEFPWLESKSECIEIAGSMSTPLPTQIPTHSPSTFNPTSADPTSRPTLEPSEKTTQVPTHTPTSSEKSPYTIPITIFSGPFPVAAESCNGGCPSYSTCVGNSAAGQQVQDSDCSPCHNDGQTWWPCNVDGLCWCHADDTPRIAPALKSGLEVEAHLDPFYTLCDDILTPEVFHQLAPNANEPYTYTGLCDAILSYNAYHSEKAFGMGTIYQRTAELAAFIGNTLHESDEYQAPREYLMCADNIVQDGEVYCKPCASGSFDWTTKTCSISLASGALSEYCDPDQACDCGVGYGESSPELQGYVAAKYLYFGRGAIQLSWNYNYKSASIALTGSPDTFCANPDIVATEGQWAWGTGLFFWMEHVKDGTTSHIEALVDGGNFGGTVNNINGGLECPSSGWHVDAVKARLNRYCRAAKVLGLPNTLPLDNCAGLQESLSSCLVDGSCNDCQHYGGAAVSRDTETPTRSPSKSPVTAVPSSKPTEKEASTSCQGSLGWHIDMNNNNGCVNDDKYHDQWLGDHIRDQMFHTTVESCCAAFFPPNQCKKYDDWCAGKTASDGGTVTVPAGQCKHGWHIDIISNDGCTNSDDVHDAWLSPQLYNNMFFANAEDCCKTFFIRADCPKYDVGCLSGFG